MKLLLDQGLPRSTVEKLRLIGIESIHVGDIGMAAAPLSASRKKAYGSKNYL